MKEENVFTVPADLRQRGSTLKNAPMMDGLMNALTGLGTNRSKRANSFWRYGNINNFPEYEAAYQESWLARRIVDVIPSDMIREWREIKCDKADEVRAEEDRLQVAAKVEEVLRYSRLYGGGGLLMITDQDLTKPLDPAKIKKGGLKRLVPLDRWYLSAGNIKVQDFIAEDFMLPAFYWLNGSKDSMVHRSHVIRFSGEPLPIRLSLMANGWGDSSLRQAMEVVEDFVASVGGIAESMQEFNVDTISKPGLMDDLGTDQGAAIIKRFQTWAMMKSSIRVSLLDGDETYNRNSLTYSGISDIIELQMKLVAGAAHTPVTKLFGDSAKGLNATGEGDDVNYNTYIKSQQSSKLDPALRMLDEVLVRSALGFFPDDFNYVWRPLDIPDPNEEANANKVQADADIAYLDAGVVSISQIQRNLQAKEKYQFDPARIDELEKLENEIPLEEMMNEGKSDEGAASGDPNSSEKNAEAGVPGGDRNGLPGQN